MSESNTVTSAIEEEETPCRLKSSNQRRSIIFRRRSLLQTQDKDESNVACNKQKPDRRTAKKNDVANPAISDKKIDESRFDLQKYINDLKQERQVWTQTLLQRKRQHKSMLKQTSDTQCDEQDIDLNLLSESERNFLLVRPNYEHIYEKAKKLSIMAAETEMLNEQVTHLYNRCILRAKKKHDDLKRRIIEMID